MNPYKIDFSTVEWESPMPGVRHKAVIEGGVKLRLVEYTPEMAPHWCDRGHVGQILEGDFEIEFDGGAQVFRAGDGVLIPSGEQHRHMARVLSAVVRAIFVEEA